MLMKKGAEADLFLEPFTKVLHGAGSGMVVVKRRVAKRYRIPEIDRKLRESRTSLEARLLSDSKKAGVSTPPVYLVDRRSTSIVMRFIEGEQIKRMLNKTSRRKRREICLTIGKLVGRLHRAGIVHGDLTTSNMILGRDGRIYLVDFGLGEYDRSTEARGVDLHLLKRALQSVHFRIADEVYRDVLSGYRHEFGRGAEEVITRAEEIGRRGRYVEREERPWR
ncbi:MAG: KEOPS complex kinase/ATPase Bud32 [Candidatus Hadarchaeales archaeon]